MKMEINVVIEEEAFRNINCRSMRINVIINNREYNSLKAIPEEAEPDYFDYIWDEVGDYIREEYIKSLK